MNKLALYVFPLGVVIGGPFLPIAIIIYWVSNNIWTFGQQHLVFNKIEKEEEAKTEEALARRSANAPAPGAKPTKSRKNPVPETAAGESDAGDTSDDVPGPEPEGSAGDNGSSNGATTVDRSPRPGARPKKRKR
jgi:YidC/Oxa1 family membrane protein insertase